VPDAGAVQAGHAVAADRRAQAEQAMVEAEAAHLAAIAALEAAYGESRGELPEDVAAQYDEQFASMRTTLQGARAQAGSELGARLRLLDAYAAHRRSMKSALTRMQERE
jgi:hypothetical protein